MGKTMNRHKQMLHLRLCLRWSPLIVLLCTLPVSGDEATSTSIAQLDRETEVDFQREVLPILRRNCLACHNATEAESDLVLEESASILKGGDSGPAVIPGNGPESLLLQVAAYQVDPEMPPPDNDVGARRLTSEELGLIQLWIEQGAVESSGGTDEVDWQPLPEGVNPVYAVAVSPDGQFAAAGRANQIFMYHLPSQRMVARLTDPSLAHSGVYRNPGVAHLDLIQSLRFSPDGRTLASGGYQTVKLWQRANARRMSLGTIVGEATTVAVAPDGRTVAVGLREGSIQLISGVRLTTLEGHSSAVSDLRFVGEARLVSSSQDGTVRCWDLESESLLGTLTTPSPVHAMVTFSDNRFATGGEDGKIRIWSALPEGDSSIEPMREFTGHSGRVTSLAVTPNAANRLVSGSHDGTIRLWDIEEGKQLHSSDHEGPIEAVAVSQDGKRFASAGSNKVARLWDGDGKQIAVLKGDYRQRLLVEGVERVVAIAQRGIENAKADLKEVTDRKTAEEKNAKQSEEAITKADEELAKKEEIAKAKAQEVEETAKLLATAQAAIDQAKASRAAADELLSDATDAVTAASAGLAAAQQATVVAAAQVKSAEEAQQKAAQQLTAAEDELKKAESKRDKANKESKKSNDEREAAQSVADNARRAEKRAKQALESANELILPAEQAAKAAEEIHGEKEKSLTSQKDQLELSNRPFFAVAFSPNGASVATGGDGGILSTWDAETGAPIDAHDDHESRICAITYSPAGDAVTVSLDGGVSVWHDNAPWRHVRSIGSVGDNSFVDRVTALDFSSDGERLATGGGEPSRSGELKIWNVASGKLVREIADAHSDTIQCLRFSPSGEQIASSGADRFAKVFNAESGEFIRAFEGHTHHVLGVSWRADGRLLATSGADNVVKIWDARTGDQKRTITGFNKEVTAVCFLAATDNVVASSGDNSVQLKNTGNGRRVRNLEGAADFMYSVAASANGKTIVGGGQDSVVRVWKEDGTLVASFAAPAE